MKGLGSESQSSGIPGLYMHIRDYNIGELRYRLVGMLVDGIGLLVLQLLVVGLQGLEGL